VDALVDAGADRTLVNAQEVTVATLVVFRGDSVENELHVGHQTVRIGRDARNEVVLDDKGVSRFHAEVVRDGGRFIISDLNSRNGVWINKQRINGKAPLEIGVPVTIGAYELTLEDDAGSSDFSNVLPAGNRTAVSTGTVAPVQEHSSSSGTRTSAPSAKSAMASAAVRKPAVFWSAIGVGTLALCVLTYVAVRRFTAKPPPPPQVVENTLPPIPVDTPAPPPPSTPVTQDIVAGYLEAAQYAIEDKDYQAAADDIDAALELDPANQDLLGRKKQIQDLAAAPPPVAPKPAPVKPVEEVKEAPGIPRRAGESAADYNARVQRIGSNMREGLRLLDSEEFAAAITRFQAVDRDQKGYMNIDGLLTDATTRQKKQVDTALSNGQENERQNQLVNAIRWYERALFYDPNSAPAKDKLAGLADRRLKEGMDALSNAEVLRKRNLKVRALAAYQQAVDLLPAGNEKKAEAQQWVEKLKQ
jgi:pSer/pThr/pTyr-binding forkhead associated (FHA) protein